MSVNLYMTAKRIRMGKIKLPRVYKERDDSRYTGKYKMHEGKPKLSYSQISSWNDPSYKKDYIKSYFVGIKLPDSDFAAFGTLIGEYIEDLGSPDNTVRKAPSQEDIDAVMANVDFPDNSIYEDLIVVEVNDELVIEGFADRCVYEDGYVTVEDFKTGNIAKKADFYASDDYMQTRLYAYQKEKEGYKVKDCRVKMLGRKGNGTKVPIGLTGDMKIIDTPYDKKKVEKFLKKAEKTAKEISDLYATYLKYFG